MSTRARSLAVAVLTRERWQDVDRCLGTLVPQAAEHGVPVHVLVNGTTDDTFDQIRRKYPEVEIHQSSENLGCPGGRNRLMELIDATWIAHVDDDGTVGSGFVDAALSAVEEAPPERVVIAGHIVDVEVDPDPERSSGPTFRFSGGVCVLDRSAFQRLGGYPSDGYRQGEEGDYAIRLHDAGLRIWKSADLVLFHPLKHSEAKRRELLRTGLRQSILTGLRYSPWWFIPIWVLWKFGTYLFLAVRLRAFGDFVWGLRDTAPLILPTVRSRRPVKLESLFASSSRLSRSSRRNT